MNDTIYETDLTIEQLIELVDKTFNIVELIEFEDRIAKLISERVNVDREKYYEFMTW